MRVLRIWLPPQFDPNAGTRSAQLLNQRLLDFEVSHPGLDVVIRIKTEDGETGLLNSLSVTSMAAPDGMPDLIALSRPALEAAVQQGLLHPIDGLSALLEDPNWYAYAREVGQIKNVGYGFPFAGDALVLVHRPEIEVRSWDDILLNKAPVVFFARDPQGLVGLSLYISAGGRILDEQGLPALEEQALIRALTLVQQGIEANVFSPPLLNFDTEAQTLQVYRDGRADLSITWAKNDLQNSILQPIPGLIMPHTFATGWVWALAGSDLENQHVAIELAEFLLEDEFINGWIQETGFLPTRRSSDRNASLVLDSAHVLPATEVLEVLGPLMQEGLTRVLNGEKPEVVAGSVIEKLK